ncbi:uncharacterized protein LOC144665802 isoform X1 [Oculina patagonica]
MHLLQKSRSRLAREELEMSRGCVLLLAAVAYLYGLANTVTDETLQVNFFNRDIQSSPYAMCAMLKKADLGNKGFTKEVTVTSKLAEDSQNDTTETTYFFYKSVNCTYKAMREVEKELNSSLPGFIENDMPSKISLCTAAPSPQ